MDLDDLSNRQFAFDSWAASDLDETSGGMPALDIPVNPLFAAAEERSSAYDNTAAYANRPSEQPRAGRIETEDYGQTSSGYSRDPFAATPAPDYNQASVKAASASSYTHAPTISALPITTPKKNRRAFRSFRRRQRLSLSSSSSLCSA